ncbi:MAG TPA: creatininase family protein, partial [Methylomirabilota bacterium]|nr:creatininase family protein [Methylomirabilota bacterium]
MIRLAECTYREAGRLARNGRAVVLLPLGAIEQHGPHLPLLVDWLGAEELARHVAPHLERAGHRVVLAPAVPYGASPLAVTWPGTVSLAPATLRRVIVEIVRSLARHGFRRFVLTNYQADPGQLRAMAEAKRELTAGGRLRVLVAGFAPARSRRSPMFDPRVRRLSRSPQPEREWHAGEMETALVLARRPEL